MDTSELFLIDAEQLAAELQRFAAARRGSATDAVAAACEELADLLRTVDLADHARCAKALARSLASATSPEDLGWRRELAQALGNEVGVVTDALRRRVAVTDGAAFADDWMQRLAQFAPGAEAAPVVVLAPPPVPPPADPPAAVPALAPVANRGESRGDSRGDNQRQTALRQAAQLHASLPQTHRSARAGVERVVADLVGQARIDITKVGTWPLPVSVRAAPEALVVLDAALACLPVPRRVHAHAKAGLLSLDLAYDAERRTAAPTAEALAVLAAAGGRIDFTAGGLRLSLPRDAAHPLVVVLRAAHGWMAVHALQYTLAAGPGDDPWLVEATGLPVAQLPAPETPVHVWRHDLPALAAQACPATWVALVSDASGRLMPLCAPPAGSVGVAPLGHPKGDIRQAQHKKATPVIPPRPPAGHRLRK
ncbi:MAG: hypothetical protein QE285_12015 [Aquabacterium sp.]|nr:hypothetical protein [Aquabacterium sp.]